MKIFKLMMVALVAMVGLSSCSKDDCEHDFIEHDFTQELVGTWTYLEEGQAEAMVINPDGSFEVTGVMNGGKGALYEERGTIKVVNNKVTLAFEGDKDVIEGRLEFVAGKSLSIVMFDDNDVRLTYNYCKEDLSEEIVGMWVCHDGLPGVENDMAIKTYSENGKYTLTTQASSFIDKDVVMAPGDYKIIGDLLFMNVAPQHLVARLTYTPNGTTLGDIMTETLYAPSENGDVYLTSTWLRIKQNLDLAGKAYDYSATYITNAKGEDKDIKFLDTTFNFAKMDGSIIDKFLKSVLYAVEFPDAKTFQYNCLLEGQNVALQLPIEVEGNKMTIKMSSRNAAYRDVVVYAFQDVDCTQFHMYMPTTSFENFFSNMSLSILSASGQVDINNSVHVDAVYQEVADAVESINLSIVMKAAK